MMPTPTSAKRAQADHEADADAVEAWIIASS